MQYTDYNIFMADEGNLIFRRSDDLPIGIGISLGENDSIDNYYESAYTQEEWDYLYNNSKQNELSLDNE